MCDVPVGLSVSKCGPVDELVVQLTGTRLTLIFPLNVSFVPALQKTQIVSLKPKTFDLFAVQD